MFSYKQIGILYNRVENMLRIIGGSIIKGGQMPNSNEIWEILHKQLPFEASMIKPCEITTMDWDTIWIIDIKIYLEKDFTILCSLWLCPHKGYRIICNTKVLHLSDTELEEYNSSL